jgi:transketolase
VGLGIAEAHLRARFGAELCDHHTFVICGDGDLSEGVSHEAASLAGHLGLGRLVYIYDDNHITIDGPTELALTDDAAARFEAYGWHVVDLGEAANDLDALEAGDPRGHGRQDRPSLVVVRSHIAYPSEKLTDSPKAHGKAFDADEIAATKTVMGMDPDQTFHIADDVAELYRAAGRRGREARLAWEQRLAAWTGDRAALDAAVAGTGVDEWAKALPAWEVGDSVATRVASGACFAALTETVPGLLGGGADLSSNTGTLLPGATAFSATEPGWRQLYFGVREHGMGSIMNGMAAHGGVLPVGGTFFVFSDYMRPPVRLAALAGHQVIYSWTHDSVGVGEDGPTHQPVEHLASLRAMPGLRVVRPADANETAAAWRHAVETDGPPPWCSAARTCRCSRAPPGNDGASRGAYVLPRSARRRRPARDHPGRHRLGGVGLPGGGRPAGRRRAAVRVVSMPCWEDFDEQDEEYQA